MGKVKLQEHKKRWSLTIPTDIVERAGLIKGEPLFISYDRRADIIEIERKKN